MKNIDYILLNEFQERINYNFKDQSLLIEALSHPSMKNIKGTSNKSNYERLEFFGDTVLSLIITEFLLKKFPDYDEGKLAKARSFLVMKDTISKIAHFLSIDEVMIMTQEEELSGGRLNKNNLENTIEAIIGAIYLDGGLESARDFVLNFWSDLLDIDYENITTDYKSKLQEWSQGRGMSIPSYVVVKRLGEDHAPIFTVKVTIDDLDPEFGEGKSIKEAQKIAALKLLSRVT